jgi:hypothetical protein
MARPGKTTASGGRLRAAMWWDGATCQAYRAALTICTRVSLSTESTRTSALTATAARSPPLRSVTNGTLKSNDDPPLPAALVR